MLLRVLVLATIGLLLGSAARGHHSHANYDCIWILDYNRFGQMIISWLENKVI